MKNINWNDWEKSSFAKAKEQDMPVLLSISASWCHWCHVMDDTSLSDASVVQVINSDFIAVRADTDQRPDINLRYNAGGWPTVAVLDNKGGVLSAATYLPPEELIHFLLEAKSRFYDREIEPKSTSLHSGPLPEPHEDTQLEASPLDQIIDMTSYYYDADHGGFGTPKFTLPQVLELLFNRALLYDDPASLNMAINTLDHMHDGAIFDKLAGGFFRYATKHNWTDPHYEKLLQDNARLVGLYLKACSITGNKDYIDTAKKCLVYLETNLKGESGYWSSQDADEKYYRSAPETRSKLNSPRIDKTLFTASNAEMARALLKASQAIDERYLNEGLFLLHFLLQHAWNPGAGMYHMHTDHTSSHGPYLADQTTMVLALLDAYEITGEKGYLDKCMELGDLMMENFWDDNRHALTDRSPDLEIPAVDLRCPLEDNMAAANAFTALHYITGKPDYRNTAESILKAFSRLYLRSFPDAADYGQALLKFLEPPIELYVLGKKEDAATRDLIKAAMLYGDPRIVLVHDRDPEAHMFYREHEIPQGRSEGMYVCRDGRCFHWAENPQDLYDTLKRFAPEWRKKAA